MPARWSPPATPSRAHTARCTLARLRIDETSRTVSGFGCGPYQPSRLLIAVLARRNGLLFFTAPRDRPENSGPNPSLFARVLVSTGRVSQTKQLLHPYRPVRISGPRTNHGERGHRDEVLRQHESTSERRSRSTQKHWMSMAGSTGQPARSG